MTCWAPEHGCVDITFVFEALIQHPRRHLETWYSNDQRTKNQIDYVLVRARWASSVLDCRSYRGADTGSANNSDHVLLRAAVRLRLKANHACQRSDRFDVSKLKTAAGPAFQIELRNRFEARGTPISLSGYSARPERQV